MLFLSSISASDIPTLFLFPLSFISVFQLCQRCASLCTFSRERACVLGNIQEYSSQGFIHYQVKMDFLPLNANETPLEGYLLLL